MLAGIIQDDKNDYYIHLNNVNSKYELDIVKISGFNEVHLTKEEIHKLVKETFASKMTFKKETNNYKIYIDEAGNERFFKDGVEDYKLLFLKNGKDAVRYIKKIYKIPYDDEILECTFINSNITRRIMISIISLCIIIDGVFIYTKGDFVPIHSKVYNKVYGMLDTEKIVDLINNSSLSEKSKKVLINYNLLNDAVDYSLTSDGSSEDDVLLRNYELYQKFNNLQVKYFSIMDVEAAGYYNPTKPNNLYLIDCVDDDKYSDILAHEYAHLLQVPTSYQYLCESIAEVVSSEYYNTFADGYPEEVKRLKVLMEIIGPEPVLNFNYKRGDTSLRDAISLYLNESETADLFNQFSTGPNDWGHKESEDAINQRIDGLLAKMYFNKTGLNIEDNEMIKLIYKGNNERNVDLERVYFNKHSKYYNEDFCVSESREDFELIDIDMAVNNDLFKSCSYYTIKNFYPNEISNDVTLNNEIWKKTIYEPDPDAIVIDNNDYILIKSSGVEYNISEAIACGILVKKTHVCTCEKLDHFDYIKGRICRYVEVEFKDGSIAKYVYNSDSRVFDCVEHYKYTKNYYPSISKEFTSDVRIRTI